MSLSLVVVLVAAGAASAAPKQLVNEFGGTGSGDGQLVDPWDVAIDQSNGNVYVVDNGNDRISVFDEDGTFLFKFGSTGSGKGQFIDPRGVAIDQSADVLYVTDEDNFRVQKFDLAGNFLAMWGWGVADGTVAFQTCLAAAVSCRAGISGSGDGQFLNTFAGQVAVAPDGSPNDGNVYVADAANERIQVFSPAGAFVAKFGTAGTGNGQFASNWPKHVAIDSAGNVYASDSNGGSRVQKFSSAHAFVGTVSGLLVAGTTGTDGLAVDPTNDHLFVLRDPNSGDSVVQEFNPAGAQVPDSPHGNGHGFNTNQGIAVNSTTGRIYIGRPQSTSIDVVSVLGEIAGPLQATIDPVTEVTSSTATLNATIDPNGARTSFRFEISDDGVNYTSIPVPDQDAGLGTTAQQYSFAATGLKANTFYRVRLVATRVDGDQVTTGNLNFLTAVDAPKVTSVDASQISDTGARLNGRLHPGGLETAYWFEWGDDRYGNQTPVPAATTTGGVEQTVGVTLSGLEPERHYHFRLCAQNSATNAPVCGVDRMFQTRPAAAAPLGRAYEMVTSPDKVLRRGGDHGAGVDGPEYVRLNGGLPDLDGGALMIGLYAGVNDPASGAGWSGDYNYEVRTREDRDGDGRADGWYGASLQDVPPVWAVNGAVNDLAATSGDFSVSAWDWTGQLFENQSLNSIHVLGDDGGPRGAGWYPWLDPAWFAGPIPLQNRWLSRIAQHGERLVGWSLDGQQLRDLRAVGDPLAPDELSPPQTAGKALFLADPSSDWAPRDLVNECSGTAGDDATVLPARVGSGAASDTLGGRECGAGAPTSVLGALLGGTSAGLRLEGAGITSLSDDGDRIFFASPDPVPTVTPTACTEAVGPATNCPPQLFVRQYDDQGNATVRWLSRAEDALFNAPQQIELLGNGVSFEGAARDGSAVYFRTNAPLTVDDPNGGAQLPAGHTTGTASPVSWDLYRYDLGADNDTDPAAGDPGDRLTRVSGGPSLDADPNTNCTAASADCGGAANGGGSAVRFMSDDGSRVYFVTAGPIGDPGDSWNDAPAGSAATNVPGGTPSSNASTRNLYLYDERESGTAAYRFVARIPFAASGNALDQCSSSKPSGGAAARNISEIVAVLLPDNGASCVHGTRGGDALVFETTARLTADDTDTAADVYLYDQREHALVRVSAPPPGAAPYVCATDNAGVVVARCNGDLGFGLSAGTIAKGGNADVGTIGMRNLNVAEAPDGTLDAVYFESMLPLLPADRNADRMDVYEYRRADGRLSLVSPGHPDHGSFYSGNSFDGEDVFFWTEDRISAWEIDEGDGDVYDARRGGGLPGPPATPPVCTVLADACQGGGVAPTQSRTETASASGRGNAVSRERRTLSVSGLSAANRRRAARSGVLRLRVRTSAPGVIRLGARAKIGRKTVKVAGARKRVSRAGVTPIRLRLNARARKVLRRGRALRVALRVAQSGARTRSATVTLKRSKRS